MKRAQTPWIVVGGLLIFIVLLIAIAFSYRYATTGLAIDQSEDSLPVPTVTESNYLDGPIELRAWVVNEGGVRLDLLNRASNTYVVKSVEVVGCGSSFSQISLAPESSEIVSISCALTEGDAFTGDITLSYIDPATGETSTSQGKVTDTV